jgi:hypothetical protein
VVLVVDRYNGYNQVKCRIQYCYAHLLREMEDLRDEFEDEAEVQLFAATVIALLADAMPLHSKPRERGAILPRGAQAQRPDRAGDESRSPTSGNPPDPGAVRGEGRADVPVGGGSPRVPADNNRAERELRPTVIARKVSFGAQSEAGARTREVMMSLMQTLRKRVRDPIREFKRALDELALDANLDVVKSLLPAESG